MGFNSGFKGLILNGSMSRIIYNKLFLVASKSSRS